MCGIELEKTNHVVLHLPFFVLSHHVSTRIRAEDHEDMTAQPLRGYIAAYKQLEVLCAVKLTCISVFRAYDMAQRFITESFFLCQMA